jgi:hypothetical protein
VNPAATAGEAESWFWLSFVVGSPVVKMDKGVRLGNTGLKRNEKNRKGEKGERKREG